MIRNFYRSLPLLIALLFTLGIHVACAHEPSPQTQEIAPSDSLDSGIERSNPLALIISEEELADFDHEEFFDWIAIMPGFYPLDRSGFAQPCRGQMMGLAPWTLDLYFRGRRMRDHLSGAPDLGWIPPESLSRIRFSPLDTGSPGARLDAELRTLEPTSPSSRVATRDGYYGLGTVDFDLAEKVAPSLLLNGGGRVSTYGGRHAHSAGYGLNLRAEVVWFDTSFAERDSSGLWGWWGIMQNKRNSQVPFGSINYNRDRYETDAVFHWHDINFRGYGIQQRETYGSGDADSWDELGLAVSTQYSSEELNGEFGLFGAAARWRMKTLSWKTTSFGGADAKIGWRIVDALKLKSNLGFHLSDDFDPERHLGLSAEAYITSWAILFTGASQHQRWPSRFETAADFAPGTHYLPYDPAFYQHPGLSVQGDSDLSNETYSSLFAGSQLQAGFLSGALAYLSYRTEDRIAWEERDGVIKPYNAPREDTDGALGWVIVRPFSSLQIGGTGSYLPLKSGERRLFPEAAAHAWVQYKQLAFNDKLDLRLRIREDFWGRRWFPVNGGWEEKGEAFVLSARISARLYGVHIYWGINNILTRRYDLLPGLPMMHKEEIWGISWNLKD